MVIEKLLIKHMFQYIKSGLALDIAPHHTGVVIWDGTEIHEYGFEHNLDTKDKFWEYKLRREFKNKLKGIVAGKSFEACVVEDVYGGENFMTTRQLLAMNTVIDELIFDGVCFVDNFYRWKSSEWLAKARVVYKQRGKLKTKVEIQGILEYLEYDFLLNNKDKSKKEKEAIYFEDICDACGMLLAVCADKVLITNKVKHANVRMSEIKMFYVNDMNDAFYHRDKRLSNEDYVELPINSRNIENDILENVKSMPDSVICSELPVSRLGRFGIEHGFDFWDNGEGYLVYYRKVKK